MTPKEKAIELANKFITKSIFEMTDDELKNEKLRAKNLTLICIDEILGAEMCDDTNGCNDDPLDFYRKYWLNVKTELNAI